MNWVKTMTGDVGFIVRLGIPIALMMTKADLIQYRGVADTMQCYTLWQ
jgi:hypothetical protein